jgi:HAD superfamily hydrolase (TIGR01509 family)
MGGDRRPAAVLWDMDGTLVDTEPYWIASEHALVAEFGGAWTDADAHSIVGFDLLDAAVELRDRGGVRLEPVEIVERLLDGVIGLARAELPWRVGARELLAECTRAGIPCAMVTMSWRRLADAVLAASPPGSFAASITGDEVTRGKPDPEPYLAAAAALGVDPSACVAIEDSPTGVASALGAGCATLGVPHVVPLTAVPGLTIVASLADVALADLRALVDR